MFSLSLLATDHPCPFQRTRVRPSTAFYRSFSLSMARSLGFGSTACNSTNLRSFYALFRLGFPPASALLCLNLATYSNSQAHSTKGMPSPSLRQAPTACKPMVSGSISLPSRGSFHLSLTVLCAIGSCPVFSLGTWSSQFPAGFLVSRRTQVTYQRSCSDFRYGTFTLFGRPSQWRSPIQTISYCASPLT